MIIITIEDKLNRRLKYIRNIQNIDLYTSEFKTSIDNIFNYIQYSYDYYDCKGVRHFVLAYINENDELITTWSYKRIHKEIFKNDKKYLTPNPFDDLYEDLIFNE